MREVRTIIAGGRDFNDYNLLEKKADELLQKFPADAITVVSGGARGADKLGADYARKKNYCLKMFPAKWDELGKSAGYARNKEMAEYCRSGWGVKGVLLAFWDGESRGTRHMIDTAKRYNMDVTVVYYDKIEKEE